MYFRIFKKITTCLSKFLNLDVKITAPNSALRYENLPVLATDRHYLIRRQLVSASFYSDTIVILTEDGQYL